MHISKEKRYKFDDKSTICIFVGYNDARKAYRVYKIKTKKVNASKDVLFDEDIKDSYIKELELLQHRVVGEQPESSTPTPSDLKTTLTSDNEAQEEVSHESSSTLKKMPKWYPETVIKAQLPDVEGKRKTKMRKNSVNFAFMSKVLNTYEPSTYEEACQHQKWRIATDVEMEDIKKNKTWDLVKLLPEKEAIGYK